MLKLLRMRVVVFLLLCLSIIVSCNKDKFDYGSGDKNTDLQQGEGSVDFKLNTVYGVSPKSGNPASELNLNPADFAVEIFNSNNVKIKKWNKYSEIGNPVKFNTGKYTFKAYYGDSTATGFDVVYFAGKTDFTVEGQVHKAISVTCMQSNVQMKLIWGENLVADYQDYTVKVYREGFSDTLSFVKSETRSGYIPAGILKFKIYLTDKEGKKRVYVSSSLDLDAKPNDFITLTVNTKEAPSYDVGLSFKIDSSTDDREIEVVVPGLMFPKDSPAVSSDDIDAVTKTVTVYDGMTTNLRFNINAPGSIESCILKTVSGYLTGAGWPAEVNLANPGSEEAALLKSFGLSWAEGMKETRMAYIDFAELIKNIKHADETASNTFTIQVSDIYGQKGEYTFQVNTRKVDITLSGISDGNMWSTYAYASVTTNVPDNTVWQVEANNGGGWSSVPSQVLSAAGDERKIKITSLLPGASYQFRAVYLPRAEITSGVLSGVTEAGAQLPNGDMESWSSTRLHTGGYSWDESIDCVFPGGGWSSRNERTTKGAESASDGGLMASSNPNFGVFWRWCSGTVSTSDKTQGNTAAEISTLAFYNQKVKGSWKRESVYTYTRDDGTAYVGYLFTGTFDKDSDSYTLGIPHASRPESISFDYKYAPCTGGDNCLAYAVIYDAAGREIAGTGEFRSTGQEAFTTEVLNFNYTDMQAKAAKIVVFFRSGYDTNILNMRNVNGSYSASPFKRDRIVGSVLTVDNIVLNY